MGGFWGGVSGGLGYWSTTYYRHGVYRWSGMGDAILRGFLLGLIYSNPGLSAVTGGTVRALLEEIGGLRGLYAHMQEHNAHNSDTPTPVAP